MADSADSIILGSIEPVPFASMWANEREFTAWLSREENLERLKNTLGLEFTLEGVEMAVGPYSADIVGRDLENARVVVECQYGKTNHDHLGKLITYSSGLNASTIIWIAETFSEEHQKSIEWLNNHTDGDTQVYALRVELFRIEDSPPAIQFIIVEGPKAAGRTHARGTEQLTDAQQLQLDFWTLFSKRLLEKQVVARTQEPGPRYWFNVPLGHSGVYLSNICNTFDERIGVRVYVRNTVAEVALPQLIDQQQEIENEIGEKLEWDANPTAKDKVIALRRKVDLNERSKWPEYVDWMVDKVSKFRAAFAPRIQQIDWEKTPGEDNGDEPKGSGE